MKTSELRLKNWISDGIFIFLVSEISRGGIIKGISICMDGVDALEISDRWRLNEQYSLNIENIKPIPITEEWLKKLGFEINSGKYELKGIRIKNNKVCLASDDPYCGHVVSNKIYYVHQLQNLYFALTGQELEISL